MPYVNLCLICGEYNSLFDLPVLKVMKVSLWNHQSILSRGKITQMDEKMLSDPTPPGEILSKDELQARIFGINELRNVSFYSPAFQIWHRETEDLLVRMFGADSSPTEDFQAILFTPLFLSCRCGDTVFTEAYEKGLEEVRSILVSCLKSLK
jgi:hypothetical protein